MVDLESADVPARSAHSRLVLDCWELERAGVGVAVVDEQLLRACRRLGCRRLGVFGSYL